MLMIQTAQDLPNKIITQLNPPPTPADEDVSGNSDTQLAKIQTRSVHNIPVIR